MPESPFFIYLIPLGPCDGVDLGIIGESIEEQFGVEVRFLGNPGPPAYAYSPARHQYNSNIILRELEAICPSDGLRILGITALDLFNPIFSYVFGEAQFCGRCAVISTYRLRGVSQGTTHPDSRPLHCRVEKEAIHELGHTFGLRHCPDRDCVMYYSPGLLCTDRKFACFCRTCLDLLAEYLERDL